MVQAHHGGPWCRPAVRLGAPDAYCGRIAMTWGWVLDPLLSFCVGFFGPVASWGHWGPLGGAGCTGLAQPRNNSAISARKGLVNPTATGLACSLVPAKPSAVCGWSVVSVRTPTRMGGRMAPSERSVVAQWPYPSPVLVLSWSCPVVSYTRFAGPAKHSAVCGWSVVSVRTPTRMGGRMAPSERSVVAQWPYPGPVLVLFWSYPRGSHE